MSNLRVGIIGYGFVGKAMSDGFSKNTKNFHVDPKLGTKISDLKKFDPDVIFICVPTPMGADGTQDDSILLNVCVEISEIMPDKPLVIKSTVVPSSLDKAKALNKNLIYNPEFLREKFASHDFINASMIILGGEREVCKKVETMYKNHSICTTRNFIYTDINAASLIKYFINSFLALKVIYFNQLNEVFKNTNTDESWGNLISIISQDARLGTTHMNVPGHDGRKGYGGACFPKDTTAFLKYSSEIGVDISILKEGVLANNKIRSSYSELDKREKEQNVKFT